MKTNPHDVWEALYQAPGDQVIELGVEIDALRKSLTGIDVTPALRDEFDRRLAYFKARTCELAPVIEVLHEVAERAVPFGTSEDIREPTEFIAKHSPPFALTLLSRLGRARTAGNEETAADLRDICATYARCSPIESVREVLIDGLRLDALVHGETKPGYVITPLERLRDPMPEPA